MHALRRRLTALEVLTRPRVVQPCLVVYQFQGESTMDALQAAGDRPEPDAEFLYEKTSKQNERLATSMVCR